MKTNQKKKLKFYSKKQKKKKLKTEFSSNVYVAVAVYQKLKFVMAKPNVVMAVMKLVVVSISQIIFSSLPYITLNYI